MNLSKQQIELVQQALGYALTNAITEEQANAFAVLKSEVDANLILKNQIEKSNAEHNLKGCPFNYCDSNPTCVGKCQYAKG